MSADIFKLKQTKIDLSLKKTELYVVLTTELYGIA